MTSPKFQPPGVKQLRDVAARLGFNLREEAARSLLSYTRGFSDAYAWLDSQVDELPPIKYPKRNHRRPSPEENPHGAWYLLTEIQGSGSGPLRGRRVALKDNIFIANVPLMNGAGFLEGTIPEFDATVVTRLLDAGADIRGKAVCEFLCVSGGSATASTGIVRNPFNPEFSAGGSSSGSAALVASGAVDMSLGCDQAGSIRIPSSWCGVYGLKPTHGLVPYTGILGMDSTLDYVGPITANVADNALLLEVLAGPDGLDGRQRNVRVQRYTHALGKDIAALRIGVLKEGFGQAGSEADVDECVRAAATRLAELGAVVQEVSVPLHGPGVAIWSGVISDGLRDTLHRNGQAGNTDGVYSQAIHRAMDGWEKHLGDFPANAQLFVLLGEYLEQYRGRYYAKARNLVRRLRRAYDATLEQNDLLLMPTTVQKAMRNPATQAELTAEEMMHGAFNTISNTCQFDVTGHPALSIPCGVRGGLPVGMMLVGRHFEETLIYRAAHALEQSGDWRKW
ncbi:MAG: amidase [Gammaproteobacteria bacterium]|nr:amidase [Gammaproteobacteria bacterium]